jgi:transcriptional regulator with XRE-family HTH domain
MSYETSPIKLYRDEYKLSQKALASLCGITEQVILKAEQGVFPTLPPAVLNGLAYLTGDSAFNIEQSYEDWINRELPRVILPEGRDSAITNPIFFKTWMDSVCDLNDVPSTINSFCSLIKIHPYVIQKYVAGKMKEVPRQLVERVRYIRSH